ncbi:MAG: hypothetical protein HYX24_04695 [Candidatus Aenigmarchaeota archaeon]|nr:hypothetical protein [Candidatus Aenigmarchaeota archaeon]
MEKIYSRLAQKFTRAYSNLPIKIRDEIVAVVNGEPISWKIAYAEITNGTELGERILKTLKKLGIID